MRGKKYSDEIREQAFALYAVMGDYSEVSKKLNIPQTTIKTWVKNKGPDKLDELRDKNRIGFIEKAGAIIDKSMALIERRVSTAMDFETELALLLEKLSDSGELSATEIRSVSKKLKDLQIQDIRALTTAVGTLYDKRALAMGDSTENTVVEVKLPKDAEEYAG